MEVSYALYVRERLQEALLSDDDKKKQIIQEIINEIDLALDAINEWYLQEMEFKKGGCNA